ncbi:putative 4-coumarate--CoA ligase 1 [Penaeus vannamei]|uniref:Putative 4-coumarate--CoA ligase 1 n=1 Tax=Penaeus vannamei TaxID=6689 RepID=A0A3R7Q2U8_PENVA|nr:putative 4-coumarate--CoA ligase 1 [Penaeus vannamei]
MKAERDGEVVSERDLSVLGYSSGTTGVPKGARIDHGAVAYNLAMVLHQEVFPYAPTTVYGMTETMPTHFTPLNGKENIGSCGVLLPSVRARVEDLKTGAPLPPGEAGELVLYTPAMMSGYHGNEDATRDVMTADGWLRTGDVAKYDSEGYFYIVIGSKELIKVKGLQHLSGGVRFLEELPKNPTGKLLRRTLKEMAAKEE